NELPREPEATEPHPSRSGNSHAEGAASTHSSIAGRRFSPARGVARLSGGGLPTARAADGRQLPRTYVALRRAPTRSPRTAPLDTEAPIASSEQEPAREPMATTAPVPPTPVQES